MDFQPITQVNRAKEGSKKGINSNNTVPNNLI